MVRRRKWMAAALAAWVLVAGIGFAAAEPGPLAAEVAASGKPTVVDFGKGTCIQCIRQGRAIETVQAECGGKIDFRFVHVIEEMSLAGAYQIFLIPTLVFLDANGEEVYRNVGVLDADALRGKLRDLGWID